MQRSIRYALFAITTAAIAAAAFAIGTKDDAPAPAAAQPTTTKAAEQLAGRKQASMKPDSSLLSDAPLSTDYLLGKKEAPLTMIEYASMTCPHCAHFHNKVIPVLQKNYIETGKLRYILRQFPLNEPALKAAMLLDCVGEKDPGRYYLFTRVLFDAQSKWAFEGTFMSSLETFAGVGGVDKATFQQCVSEPEREIKILQQKKDATEQLAIPHTPYFFINGTRYEGDRTPEAVSAYIDALLKSGVK